VALLAISTHLVVSEAKETVVEAIIIAINIGRMILIPALKTFHICIAIRNYRKKGQKLEGPGARKALHITFYETIYVDKKYEIILIFHLKPGTRSVRV